MSNPYESWLPQPAATDTREPVEALRQFAAALQTYAGPGTDVEVPVSVHPEGGPGDVAEVQMSVYVPKTEYVNLVLGARCEGPTGYPVRLAPYFAGGAFPAGRPVCKDRPQLDDALKHFIQSPEVRSLLDYMKKHARKATP